MHLPASNLLLLSLLSLASVTSAWQCCRGADPNPLPGSPPLSCHFLAAGCDKKRDASAEPEPAAAPKADAPARRALRGELGLTLDKRMCGCFAPKHSMCAEICVSCALTSLSCGVLRRGQRLTVRISELRA